MFSEEETVPQSQALSLGIKTRDSKHQTHYHQGERCDSDQCCYPIVDKAGINKQKKLLPGSFNDHQENNSSEEQNFFLAVQGKNFKFKEPYQECRKRDFSSFQADVQLHIDRKHEQAIDSQLEDMVNLHNNHNVFVQNQSSCVMSEGNEDGIIVDKNIMTKFKSEWRSAAKQQSGSFGVVFKDRDAVTNKELAVKRSDKNVHLNELKMTRQLSNSPYIQKLAGFFIDRKYSYIIMEHAGDNLKTFGSDPTIGLSKSQMGFIFSDILSALIDLHKLGAHCDFKPENICIKWSYELNRYKATLIDLGSCLYHWDKNPTDLGVTYEYLPPDFIRELMSEKKSRPIRAKDDVYAAALTMLFLRDKTHAIIKFILNNYSDYPYDHYPTEEKALSTIRLAVIGKISEFLGEEFPLQFLRFPCFEELEPLLRKMLMLNETKRCNATDALCELNFIMGNETQPHAKKKKIVYQSSFDDSFQPQSPGQGLIQDMGKLKMEGSHVTTETDSSYRGQLSQKNSSVDLNLVMKNKVFGSYQGIKKDNKDRPVLNKVEVASSIRQKKVMPPFEDEDFYNGQKMDQADQSMLEELFGGMEKNCVKQEPPSLMQPSDHGQRTGIRLKVTEPMSKLPVVIQPADIMTQCVIGQHERNAGIREQNPFLQETKPQTKGFDFSGLQDTPGSAVATSSGFKKVEVILPCNQSMDVTVGAPPDRSLDKIQQIVPQRRKLKGKRMLGKQMENSSQTSIAPIQVRSSNNKAFIDGRTDDTSLLFGNRSNCETNPFGNVPNFGMIDIE